MNRHLSTACAFLFLTLGASLAQGQSPYAGTYQATVSSTASTVTQLNLVGREFSVENDGTFIISSTCSGSVAADGAVTFGTGTGVLPFTTGRIDNGVMTAGQLVPRTDSQHPETTWLLNAPKICGLLPMWQKVTPAGLPTGSFGVIGFAFGNGLIATLVAPNGTNVGWSLLTSPDGLTWTVRPINLGLASSLINGSRLRFVNGRFMFAINGSNGAGPTLRFYSSTDAVNWTMVDSGLPTNTGVVDFAYAYGKYWALLGNPNVSARALSSPDGITWSPVALGPELVNLSSWVQGNGLLMATGAVTYQTSDGVTWTKLRSLGVPMFGGGRFVASAQTSLSVAPYVATTDYLALTTLAPGPNQTADGFQAYTPFPSSGYHDGTAFYGISALTSGALYRSTDGNEWRKLVRPVTGNTDYISGSVFVLNGRAVTLMQPQTFPVKWDLWSAPLATDGGAPVVAAPVETTKLMNLTAAVGASAGWTAVFSNGGLLLSYQWRRNGVDIPGANAITYSISPVLATSGGTYTVVVSNAAGSATSQPVTLTVSSLPVVTSFPASVTVMEGSPVNLSVFATGTNLTYQWRYNGQPISGQTTRTLNFTGTVSPVVAGSYDCVVTGTYGTATHPAAQVQVIPAVPPATTSGPVYLSLAPGQTGTLQSGMTGALPITYQWTKDGVDVPGQTGATLDLMNLQPGDAGVYRVRATNAYGTTLGPVTVVTVAAPAPFQLLGRPLTKIVESSTARPGNAGHVLGTIGTVRFRNQTVIFPASETGSAANGLFRWQGNALSVIASSTVTAPNGQTFKDCTYPTEEAGGMVYFVGAHTLAPLSVIYSWNVASGVLTPLVQAGAAAPGGGHFGTFSYVSASGGKVYFLSLIADASIPGKRLFRRDAAGTVSLVLDGTIDLPGTLGRFAGELSGTPPFSYDGSRLIAALADVNGASGIFIIAEDGTVTPLLSSLDTIPSTGTRYFNAGNADAEPGGAIFAGSFNYEATFSSGNILTAAASSGGNVSAMSADSFLRYSFNSVVYRRANATILVADNTQPIDGLTSSSIVPEAHGNEAAFRVQFTSTNQAIYLALDRPATDVPVITSQPVSRLADLGGNVVLTSVASGEALTWQWFLDGHPIAGATLNSLALNPVGAASVGSYTATATNTFGTATTNAATVVLLDASAGVGAPVFLIQPPDQQFIVGKSFSLSGLVSGGSSNVRYQWFKNGVLVGNAATLSFTPALSGTVGTYQLVVTNDYGTVTSRNVLVTDANAPAPSVPANFAATGLALSGNTFSFSVPTLAGQSYRVESSSALDTAPWTPVETFLATGQNKLCSYVTIGTHAFYRVVIVP